MTIPSIRLSTANSEPLNADGDYVLYWMIAFRRGRSNFSLQHAVDLARQLNKPLLVFEPLRVAYPWASDRLHRFIIEGMRDNRDHFAIKPVSYFAYVEPKPGAGSGLLEALADKACAVVTDEFPCFFLPRMVAAVGRRLSVRLDVVDSNGVMPLRQPERTFTVAHSYRRWMQKNVLDALLEPPKADPLSRIKLPMLRALPKNVDNRWAAADLDQLLGDEGLSELPIDHSVAPADVCGGSKEARRRLKRFLKHRLEDYSEDRNHPDAQATTGLSPHLHFGHISAHEVVGDLLDDEGWTPQMASAPNGKNHGFWNTSSSGEALLDQILTWREIGFNLAFRQPNTYDKFESLPDWAQKTLAEHASDPRPVTYSLEQFETAETDDEIWNAAQRQLTRTGVLHNYMRMLWGKKILHWTRSPQEALAIMIELNNKYALDGRDPNSYNGIFWVLGRYDRAWGPKRPVFGSVRYMTSDSARRKLRLENYLAKFAAVGQDQLF